jgi:hypothetical protein
LGDSAVKVEQHLIEVTVLEQKLIETILNTLEKIDSAVSIINEDIGKLNDVVIGNIARLSDLDVPTGKIFLSPWLK